GISQWLYEFGRALPDGHLHGCQCCTAVCRTPWGFVPALGCLRRPSYLGLYWRYLPSVVPARNLDGGPGRWAGGGSDALPALYSPAGWCHSPGGGYRWVGSLRPGLSLSGHAHPDKCCCHSRHGTAV